MELIDSHCHLDFADLAGDRAGVLARAKAAGVTKFVNISTTKTDCVGVLATAEAHADVYCSIGCHPHHVSEEGQDFTTEELLSYAEHPKVIGLGETGLDYHYDTAPRAAQHDSFRKHLRVCKETGLPIIVHTRNAEDDTAQILEEEGAGQGVTGLLHCFSSERRLAERALAMGFYISLSGILTFKKSEDLRAIARDIPLDRLLVETDSPYLAPMPFRGKPCEPAYVAYTATVLAELKGVSSEEIGRQTTANFYRLFTKASKAS